MRGSPSAVGYAYLDNQPGPSEGERRLQAMNASRLQAYRLLAEQLYGVEIDTPRPDRRWHGISRGTIVGRKSSARSRTANLFITELKLDKADFNRLAEMPLIAPSGGSNPMQKYLFSLIWLLVLLGMFAMSHSAQAAWYSGTGSAPIVDDNLEMARYFAARAALHDAVAKSGYSLAVMQQVTPDTLKFKPGSQFRFLNDKMTLIGQLPPALSQLELIEEISRDERLDVSRGSTPGPAPLSARASPSTARA